jgi:hypothetical protein
MASIGAAASFTALLMLTHRNILWLLVRRCNLEFDVLLYRLVIQHGGTGHDNSTDHNARDGSRDNQHQRFARSGVVFAVGNFFCPAIHSTRG